MTARGRAPKVETAPGGCQFPLRAAATVLLLLFTGSGGCTLFRSQNPAPVEPGAVWTTHMGGEERAPFESERVPESTPRIAWRSDAGRGLSSAPVLTGEVLLAATTGRSVVALSAETGERFWERGQQGPLTVAPVVDEEHLYVGTGDVSGRVYSLRRLDGTERWRRDHPGVLVPLLLVGETLYVASAAGHLTALRKESGETIWSTRIGAAASSPVAVGERILVGTVRDSLYALDAESGEIVQRIALDAHVTAPPAAAAGAVYLPLQDGTLLVLRGEDLGELWRMQTDGPILASPAVARDGTVYVLDRTGTVWAASADGRPTRLAEAGGPATGSLALVDNALLVGRVDGMFLALSREDGRRLWSVSFRDGIHSPALVRDGEIWVPLRRGGVVKLQ